MLYRFSVGESSDVGKSEKRVERKLIYQLHITVIFSNLNYRRLARAIKTPGSKDKVSMLHIAFSFITTPI